MKSSYLSNLLEAISQLCNAILGGYSDEMFCSRAWRCNWKKLVAVLDRIYGSGHCESCYEWEKQHYSLPRFDK